MSGNQSAPGMLLVTHSMKENDIGVAHGFPSEELNSHEMYVSDSLTDLLQPTNNSLTVHIDGEMFSTGLEMLQEQDDAPKMDLSSVMDAFFDFFLRTEVPKIDPTGLVKMFLLRNKDDVKQAFINILKDQNITAGQSKEESLKNIKFEKEYRIKEIIHYPYNKWPLYYGNVVMVDYRSIQSLLRRRLLNSMDRLEQVPELKILGVSFNSIFARYFRAIDQLGNFGMSADILYKDRNSLIYHQDLDEMKIRMEKIGIQLSQNYSLSSAKLENMENFQVFTDMQDSSFICIIVLLTFVSGIVVYSLMLFDIDERRYEMGMLRTLGMSKKSIVVIIINQAF